MTEQTVCVGLVMYFVGKIVGYLWRMVLHGDLVGKKGALKPKDVHIVKADTKELVASVSYADGNVIFTDGYEVIQDG